MFANLMTIAISSELGYIKQLLVCVIRSSTVVVFGLTLLGTLLLSLSLLNLSGEAGSGGFTRVTLLGGVALLKSLLDGSFLLFGC